MTSQHNHEFELPKTTQLVHNLTAGAILVLGAVLFSTKAIMVKLVLQYDVDPVSLLLIRLFFALPAYVAILVFCKWKQRRLDPRVGDDSDGSNDLRLRDHLLKIILLGFVGYYLASYFDFVGLTFITASLERVILYAYPTIVLLISAIVFKKRINVHQIIAVVLCYAGIFVSVWFQQSDGPSDNLSLGVTLIFLSALTYAIYLVGSGQLIPKLGVWVLSLIHI